MEYILLALFSLASLIFIYNSHYKWTYLFAISLFVFFFGLMLAFTAQWQRALNFASILFVSLMLFHRLKIHYYKQPLLVSDFWLSLDPRNWETLLHYKGALFGILGLLGLFGYGIFGWHNVETLSTGGHLLGILLALVSFSLMFVYSKNPKAVAVWLDSLPDDGRDVFLNIPMSCRGVFFKAPKFEGDSHYFKQQKSQLDNYAQRSDKPDMVVFLLESTLNPHHFDLKTGQLPTLECFENQPDTLFNSPLRVHTYGGATWKSEFAFLSGVPSTDFGAMASAVFYSVVPHLKYSFIKNLKAQGYYCVALSPFTKGNYNAQNAYDHLGFDLMLQPQDLGYPAPLGKNLWHIGSDEMVAYAKQIIQKQIPQLENIQQPIFLYVLTMREHGPYRTDMDDVYQLADNGFSPAVTSGLNDYIERIKALDNALTDFNQFMQQRQTPYVMSYFGDHQVGICGQEIPTRWQYAHPTYVTQFVVRSNLTGFQQQQDFLDLAQAGGLLLEIAGLAADEFMQANIAMRKLSGGKLQDCDDEKLLASYRHYLYSDLTIA